MLILPEASGWKLLLKEGSHPELSHSFPKLGVVVVSKREVRAELKLFFQFSEQLREDFSSQLQRCNSQSLRRVELCLCQWE